MLKYDFGTNSWLTLIDGFINEGAYAIFRIYTQNLQFANYNGPIICIMTLYFWIL